MKAILDNKYARHTIIESNKEEIIELAKSEGVALNDEQLEAVSGGGCNSKKNLKALCLL